MRFCAGLGLSIFQRMQFIVHNRIKLIYLTDHPTYSFLYLLYRCLGVRWIITTITHRVSATRRRALKITQNCIKSIARLVC